MGKQFGEFIPEYGGAAGFQSNQGDPLTNLRTENVQNFSKLLFSLYQPSIVVKRTPAADVTFRNLDLTPGIFKHSDRRPGDLGMKVIVKRIRPKKYDRT